MTTDDPLTFHGGVFSDEIADGRCGVTIHLPPEGVRELDRRPPVSFPQKRSSPAQFNFIEPEAYPGTPFTETNHA